MVKVPPVLQGVGGYLPEENLAFCLDQADLCKIAFPFKNNDGFYLLSYRDVIDDVIKDDKEKAKEVF